MAILVDLSPETEARLKEAAHKQNGEKTPRRDAQESMNTLRGKWEKARRNGTNHSISELSDVSVDIWKGVDVDDYIKKTRKEWDDRP